jgi:pimeloyl-ACP methyl ester carboxylesterase
MAALCNKIESIMKFVECGNTDGRLVIYFHGAPGAPEECKVFDEYAKLNGLRVVCLDRFDISNEIDGERYYKYLANEIENICGGKSVDVIGFSIGCSVAINVVSILVSKVGTLHLISAAAPLESGSFIDKMAGKAIFNMAIKFPTVFSVLSYWQSVLSILAPKVLYKMLFASAKGSDKELKKNHEFEQFIINILKKCFRRKVKGYIRDVMLYVNPWERALSKCKVNCHIWHGESDNWSPVEMAHYLSKTLPSCVGVELLEGLSHYSCLYEAAPKVSALLSKSCTEEKEQKTA